MSDEQAEKDVWTEGRYRNELLEAILKRINWPGEYVTRQPDSREPDGAEAGNTFAARAVATLFDTAEPEASSPIRTIDLPAELLDAARQLRHDADEAFEQATGHQNRTGDADTKGDAIADRFGFLANVVQDAAAIVTAPAKMLATLMRDRDSWQKLCQETQEMLALTEAALGVSQAANVELVEGQSKLIGLLERVAVAVDGSNTAPLIDRLYAEWMRSDKLEDSGDAKMAELIRVVIGDVLPEIHATLNQVTAIETNAEGRLTVATPEQAP